MTPLSLGLSLSLSHVCVLGLFFISVQLSRRILAAAAATFLHTLSHDFYSMVFASIISHSWPDNNN